jgi:hypothetical protein
MHSPEMGGEMEREANRPNDFKIKEDVDELLKNLSDDDRESIRNPSQRGNQHAMRALQKTLANMQETQYAAFTKENLDTLAEEKLSSGSRKYSISDSVRQAATFKEAHPHYQLEDLHKLAIALEERLDAIEKGESNS